MAYKIKGDVEVTRGLGLGVMTTTQRLAYTPAAQGYTVFDSTDKLEYSWTGTAWKPKAGLGKHGTITTDADAGEGIYNLDASLLAFNFTLPAATGSQKRYIFIGQSFGANATTIKVQLTESLNSTLNGTFAANIVGRTWMAVDRGTGQWDIIALGLPQVKNNFVAIVAPTGSADSTLGYEVGSHWVDIIANATYVCVDATPTLAIWNQVDGASSTVRLFETITQAAHGLTLLQPVYHNGTSWLAAQANANTTVAQAIITNVIDVNTFEVTTSGTVTVTAHGLTVGNYYFLDQVSSAITSVQPTTGVSQGILHVRDVNTLFIDVEQAVSVSASSVPTSLGRAGGYRTTGNTVAVSNPIIMQTVSIATNIVSNLATTGLVSLLAGKTYKLSGGIKFDPLVTTLSVWYIRTSGGVNVSGAIGILSANAASTGGTLSSTEIIYTPTANVDVGLYLDASSTSGATGSGSYFNIEELPSSTVVSAGLLPVTPLSYIALSNSINQTPSLNAAPNFATWDTTLSTSGTLSTNINGSVTLIAGKRYKLFASLQHPGIIGSTGVFDIYDNTNAVALSNTMELIAINSAFQGTSITSTEVFFTPTVNSDVGVRYTSGAMGDIGARSIFTIEELPNSTVVPATAISVTGGNGVIGQSLLTNADGTATWSNNAIVPINAQVGTAYTPALTDGGGMITMSNAAANTLTLPLNATVAFPVGTSIAISMGGVGVTTIAGAVGVTINSAGGLVNVAAQYDSVSLLKTATDVWLLSGALA